MKFHRCLTSPKFTFYKRLNINLKHTKMIFFLCFNFHLSILLHSYPNLGALNYVTNQIKEHEGIRAFYNLIANLDKI